MTKPVTGPRRSGAFAPRVGLFGLLGSGNLGNDGSLEALLGYLRAEHPDAVLTCRCSGPEQVTARYDLRATPLHWSAAEHQPASTLRALVVKVLGKSVDAVRTLKWVRTQDVVLVPGMGVLEATLPLRPWGYPYALLLLCASGRLAGTKVALVSVGADVVQQPITRMITSWVGRLAHYRSYRDVHSREAMRVMGVDVAADEVYPDLAFGLPVPAVTGPSTGAVGVGVMAYYGDNDDRGRAGQIHRSYVDTMQRFVRWLVDRGRKVRLLIGDKVDNSVAAEILADLWATRPGLSPSQVVSVHTSDLHDLMTQMACMDTVVATRYHNVLCALKLSKPTLSLGYASKNDVLMASMGLAEFCQSARSIDFERLIGQFQALESRRAQLVETMWERNQVNVTRLEQQFVALTTTLIPRPGPELPNFTAGDVS